MCDIHIHPGARIADLAAMARRMNLRKVVTTNGRPVLRTPNHEQLQAQPQARAPAERSNVYRWTRPPRHDGPSAA